MKRKLLALALTLALWAGLLSAPTALAYDAGTLGEGNPFSSHGHTGFVDAWGTLWMWGLNYRGQLGDGTTQDSDTPIEALHDVTAVSCGFAHTAAVTRDGQLYTWGWNENGQLGDGTTNTRFDPAPVLEDVTAVSCGDYHTAAIQKDGSLWVWGYNGYGQLGDGTNAQSMTPIKVMEDVTAVSCGMYSTAAIQEDGTLWTWGGPNYVRTPQKVLDNVTTVSCGNYGNIAAIQEGGTLWVGGTWGEPLSPLMDNVAAVSCGLDHNGAITTDGTLYMWGDNSWGELGNGTTVALDQPVPVLYDVAAVCCGVGSTYALKNDGSLWAWGDIGGGELGIEDRRAYTTPVKVMDNIMLLNSPHDPALTAYPSLQTVEVDGKAVEFPMYALKDDAGNLTNYVRIRDIASVLNGTKAQFAVGYFDRVNIVKGWPYTPDGSEMSTPFSGQRPCAKSAAQTNVGGQLLDLDAVVLSDDTGGGYTYYQLRDLGKTLGFNVGWSGEKGVFIETDKPYDPAN